MDKPFATLQTYRNADTTTDVSARPPQEVDFEQLVGHQGWWRLAPDIRRRFENKPTAARPIHYVGVMHRVGGSWFGAVLAQLCRLIGTPLAPHRASNVPVRITLRHDAEGGVVWERDYLYNQHHAAKVLSTKRIAADGGLTECIGCGVGMRLATFEANRALHFLSLRYFWRIAGHEFVLPSLLTPGTVHVIHKDLGDGRFRFSMTIHHPVLGMLFDQDGVFHEEAVGEGALQ